MSNSRVGSFNEFKPIMNLNPSRTMNGFVNGVLFQEYIEILMPPLIDKWNALKDEDKDLFPLLEVRQLV